VPYSEQEMSYNSQLRGQTKRGSVEEIGTVTRYAMQLDEASVLAQAANETLAAQGEVDTLKDQLAEVARKATTAEASLEKMTKRTADLSGEVTRYGTDHDRLTGANRRLEQDIARIREAIGALRMKEILGT